MSENKPGLVKKLLFPAFADAGSNGAFRASDTASVPSDATTAILDNRSLWKPQQHEVQYDGSRVGGYAPSAEAILPLALMNSMTTSSRPQHERLETTAGIVETPPPPAPTTRTRFFPSTAPSPHRTMIPRGKPPVRTSSTVTNIGGTAFPSIMHSRSIEADSTLDQSSMTASSGAVSSVLGYHFLNEKTMDDDNGNASSDSPEHDDDEPLPTPVRDNRSYLDDDRQNAQYQNVFLPSFTIEPNDEAQSEVVSDVNSTASEMGTVVGAPGRLADVHAMAALMERRDTQSPEDYEDRVDANMDHDDTVEDLALPTLDEEPDRRRDKASAQNDIFRTKEPNAPPFSKENSSASAMVTAAFRRLGTGVGQFNRSPTNISGAHSAPTTPRVATPSPKVEDYLRSLSSRELMRTAPSSFQLRSPGSSARFFSDGSSRSDNRPVLSPRFSERLHATMQQQQLNQQQQQRQQPHARDPKGRRDGKPSFRHASSLASPLRFARGCLSFDSTMDDQYTATSTFATPAIPESGPQSPSIVSSQWNHSRSPKAGAVIHSQSWDVASGTTPTIRDCCTTPIAYRSFQFGRSYSGEGVEGAFRRKPTENSRVRRADGIQFRQSRPEDAPSDNNLNVFSPAFERTKEALALRTPQRIEIEREDALDILACLVERSAAFEKELESSIDPTIAEQSQADEDENTEGECLVDIDTPAEEPAADVGDDDRISTFAEVGMRTVEPLQELQSPPTNRRAQHADTDLLRSGSFSSDLTDAVNALRFISKEHEQKGIDGSNLSYSKPDHQVRMKAINELLRSHTYATEMKRAAKSASAWLHSIGRSDTFSSEKDQPNSNGDRGEGSKEQKNEIAAQLKTSTGQGKGYETRTSEDNIDIFALKAIVHSAELRAKEKEEQAQRLNEELSKCRAEIGRLKSASRAETVFASPNRSILDYDDESTSSAEVNNGAFMFDDGLDASPIPMAEGEESTLDNARAPVTRRPKTEPENWACLADSKKEAVLLKAALAEANETIRRLHAESHVGHGDKNGKSAIDAPVVAMSNPELSKELDDYKDAIKKAHANVVGTRARTNNGNQAVAFSNENANSPSGSDRRTVNVRMLDGENFVTEWDDLAPPLPPPPDHGLRSPIVAALLKQWTPDAAMHESLLSWMERIMNGANPETVPPLTMSSLDHQIRDGFAMHVLPLLLRRSDIHVEVKTRAHRRTTYDMSVNVTHPALQTKHFGTVGTIPGNREFPLMAPSTHKAKKTQMLAFKASHGKNATIDESIYVDESLSSPRAKVSDYLRTTSYTQSDIGVESVAHSSITAQITNSSRLRPTEARLPPSFGRSEVLLTSSARSSARDVNDDSSVGSNMTGTSSQKSTQQAGLMSAIGGAFGGLLRRKPTSSFPQSIQSSTSFDEDGHGITGVDSLPSFLRQHPPSPSRTEEDEQPYHRVVSAPPGRIGVTFVEYRGHAMVSDVAPASPLSGWVFPSDILIAIDEVPVSGMRVRDIVKLLTNRKERQRALRVISSHAMNEFTLNTTTQSEVGAPS